MMGNVPISKNEILTRLSNDVEGKEIISVLLVSLIVSNTSEDKEELKCIKRDSVGLVCYKNFCLLVNIAVLGH